MKLLITEIYLKEFGGINTNTDATLLKKGILNAQEEYLADAIGWNFYTHILNAFTNNTLNTDETFLFNNFIKQALAARATLYCFTDTDVQIGTKGPQQSSSDFSKNPSKESVSLKWGQLQDSAKRRENLLKSYLKSNSGLFPEFEQNNSFYLKPSTEKKLTTRIRFI